MIKVFESFSGYGSQSIALRNIGVPYEVVAISEIDKYAIKAYEAIHEPTLNLGDICKIKVEDIPQHDLFTYSFPCQSVSVAGKQEGLIKGQTRSGLLYECEKIIEHCRPKYLLMENVKNLVSKKFKPQFDEWLEYLESLGYTNYWKVLNAKDYGVPQNRERVFCISILGEHTPYEFPKPIKLENKMKDILEDNVEEKYYLKDTKNFFIKNSFNMEAKGNGFRFSPFVKDNAVISKTITTKSGSRMDDNFIIDIQHDKEKFEFSRRNISYVERTPLKFLNRNGKKVDGDYTFCVDTCHTGGIKEVYNNNDFRIRKLTPRECFRLMGLSETDIDKIQQTGISNSQQYKLAGNSICVPVLEGIFRNLFLEYEEDKTPSK